MFMFSKHKKIIILFFLSLTTLTATVMTDAEVAFGQTNIALQSIQSLLGQNISGNGTGGQDAASVLQNLFTISIALAGVLAVLMIVIGGLEYLLSEAFTSKADAIKRIQAALWGLIIILASVVILNTINPDLLNINLSLPDLQNRKTLSPSRFLSPEEVFKMGDVKPTADEQEEAKDRNKTIVGVKQPTESGDAFRSKCISVGGNVVSGECNGVLCFYGGRNMLCEK